jgi:DNA polymerase-3 subunit alpha (Gram-positive type)
MLIATKPKNFAGLVKISGLSHGTDVWLKNAYDLVLGKTDFGKIDFDKVIGCRDDIMVQLMEYKVDEFNAFEIMEFVRRGRPSAKPKEWEQMVKILREHQVPEWYIWSCGQIKYMFPKAHAVAYVLMAVRIAWFKVYDPILFYASFFSIKVYQTDYETMVSGAAALRNKLIELKNSQDLKNKDGQLITTLEIAYEMTKRGFKFLPIDLNKSAANEYLIEDDGLRMPFTALDGLGGAVADDLIINRELREFDSIEDLTNRTKLNKTLMEKLRSYGVFKELAEKSSRSDEGLFAELD